MKIRPRYAKTLMASHRRNHNASLRRANAYNALTVRQRYGRRINRYYWHKKLRPLNEEALIEAIGKIKKFTIERDKVILRSFK